MGQHQGGFPGEGVAHMAGIIRDGHAPFPGVREGIQIIRKPLGSPAHHMDVHAIGACAQHASEPGGAERKLRIKAFLLLTGVIRDGQEFCAKGGVQPLRIQPSLIGFLIIHGSTPFVALQPIKRYPLRPLKDAGSAKN